MGELEKKARNQASKAASDADDIRLLTESIHAARSLRLHTDRLAKAMVAMPCPVAFFGRYGDVIKANRALLRLAKRKSSEVSAGTVNFLNRVTDENYAVFEAVEDVFCGKARVAEGLVYPLSLFAREDGCPGNDRYNGAVFCPVIGDDGVIEVGVMALISRDDG